MANFDFLPKKKQEIHDEDTIFVHFDNLRIEHIDIDIAQNGTFLRLNCF
jgi:hypothetical protein